MKLKSKSYLEESAPKRVCMIAFTNYSIDGRVRFEAESLAEWGHEVTFLVAKERAVPRTYSKDGVIVRELAVASYGGKNQLLYLLAYLKFLLLAFVVCTHLFIKSGIDVVH